MAMPTWIGEVQAIITVGIAGGVAFIGWQQFRLAKQKLNLDLYDRRWSIYNAMHGLLLATYSNSPNKDSVMREAYRKKEESYFLLDESACVFIEKLISEIIDHNVVQNLVKSGVTLSSLENTSEISSTHTQRTKWIMDQYVPLREEFQRFLNFNYIS